MSQISVFATVAEVQRVIHTGFTSLKHSREADSKMHQKGPQCLSKPCEP